MTMTDRWDELATAADAKPGVTRLRVAPSSPHDLFIGVIQPSARRCFWYEVPTGAVPPDYRLPHLRSIRITVSSVVDAADTTRVQLELEKTELADVFKAMVNDLVATISATPDDDSGLIALVQRTERWWRLLEVDGLGGLSTTDRRGLVGELIVLGQLLEVGSHLTRTVTTWTGPYGKHQDFQAREAAIEVKATITKQPQSLIITSERELDATGVGHLYLMHVSLDERHGGAGTSLNALVTDLRNQLAADALAAATFEEALLNAGYLDEQQALYEETTYSVRQQNAFEVRDGFPCITEADVPTGVGDITYRIQLAALQPFAVPLEDAIRMTVAP
jgi:hypothetical protein